MVRQRVSAKIIKRQAGAGSERGIVLVIALLILLSLAGIALVATVRVSSEIDRSGNYVVAKDGETLTRLVFFSALALVQAAGGTMFGGPSAPGAIILGREQFADLNLYQAGEDGTFNREVPDGLLDFGAHFQMMGQVEGQVEGYAPGEFTFVRLALTGWSEFGSLVPGDEVTRMQRIERRMRAFLLAGPYPTGASAAQ